MQKNVLVTGGAGYVGSHVCKALAAAGWRPVSYDSLRTGRRSAVRWGPLEIGDILDAARLRAVIRAHRPVAAVHCAALADIAASRRDPAAYERVNVDGTRNVLAALRDGGVGRLLLASTCAVYGIASAAPISEEAPLAPVSPYGAGKVRAEAAVRDWVAAGAGSAAILRYFNVAGADPACDIGESHEPETHLIPLALAASRGAGAPITIRGTDHPTRDGSPVRDFVHVTDLAAAHARALCLLPGDVGCQTFNLGSGAGTTVREVIAMAGEVTGKAVPFRDGARWPDDPSVLVADSSHARQALGWQPSLSLLRRIVETAWAWDRVTG